jgi:hypothetical protein
MFAARPKREAAAMKGQAQFGRESTVEAVFIDQAECEDLPRRFASTTLGPSCGCGKVGRRDTMASQKSDLDRQAG